MRINLLTMSPSTGAWQCAGFTTAARTCREAARRFKALHPEQTVAAQLPGSRHRVRP